MCGIFGAVAIDGFFTGEDFDRFVSLTDLVAYRGPDACGHLGLDVKDTGGEDRNRFDVFLGHRRLSIIDLTEGADQPFPDGRGRWIVYNGEVFNYVELRQELEAKGHSFRTASDTEVILHVYDEYGKEGFDRLNGMWGLAIVDIPKRKVVLSRDRFSIKPLYHARIGEGLFFSSEIKQLLPLLPEKRINAEALYAHVEQGIRDHEESTFFEGVRKVRPKHNLVIDLLTGRTEEKRYWDYTPAGRPLAVDDAVDRFRELFLDSVRIRLRSDVEVGALLSGGLDSSSISVVADRLQQGKFRTYSVVSREARYSEERHVDVLERERGILNTKVLFEFPGPDACLTDMQTVLYHLDEPFGGFSIVAHYKALEAVRKESDVVVLLSGQGGDETLMGYLKYFLFHVKDLARNGRYVSAAAQLLASAWKRTMLWQFRLDEGKRYLPMFHGYAPKTFLRVQGESQPIWRFHDLRERQIRDIDMYSVPSIAHYEDRTSMAHSLEIRLPFLDHRLVEFLLNLPADMKLRGGWSKYVLRAAMTELPDPIRWRRDKQGFLNPEPLWLKRDLAGAIHDVFRTSVLDEMGLIEARAFLDYYDRFRNGNRFIWYADISRVLIAELWARQHWGTPTARAA